MLRPIVLNQTIHWFLGVIGELGDLEGRKVNAVRHGHGDVRFVVCKTYGRTDWCVKFLFNKLCQMYTLHPF